MATWRVERALDSGLVVVDDDYYYYCWELWGGRNPCEFGYGVVLGSIILFVAELAL